MSESTSPTPPVGYEASPASEVEVLLEQIEEIEEERRTSYLELFFDLVFVFAITQIAALLLSDLSAGGFARSLLMLALVWWAWSGYAWTTTAIDVDSLLNRAGILAGAAAAFFMAFALPGAFGDDTLWFAFSYFAVRTIQVGLFTLGMRDDATYLRSALRLAPFFLLSPTLVVGGAWAGGDARLVLWGLAVAIDVVGAITAGGGEFRVSAAHFAERHALFVIIALGESLIAIGIGAADAHRDATLAATILVAFLGVAALWWAYFDFVAGAVEQALGRRTGRDRGHVARDLFTFAHFPLIAGIVLFAVAAKKVVAHSGDPLSGPGRFALGAAIVSLMLGLAAGRFRLIRKLSPERFAAAAVAVVATLLLTDVSALAVLGIVVAALAVALAVEAVRLREVRAAVRGGS